MHFQKRLASGLTVVGERMPHLRSVSVGLWVNAGSLHERPEENGISHFIEHMDFQGTARRSARDIADEMDGVGGNLNAFTAKDCTCFYATVVDEHLPLALDILFDMVFHPSLPEDEMEKEKMVVGEEIAMVEDTPEELSGDLLAEAYFGSHPLGQPILGPEENVAAFTRAQVLDYMNRFYQPGNMVLSIVGHFSIQQLDQLLETQLSLVQGIHEADPVEWTLEDTCTGRIVRTRPVEQVHLNLALPGLPRQDPLNHSLVVLNNLLGGGMSSRLFQRIREVRGLAYSVYSYPYSYQHCGVMSIYAGLNGENLQETLEVTLDELDQLRMGRFTEGEFARSREQMKGNYILGLDSPSNRMMGMGKGMLLYQRIHTETEVLRRINRVTRESVQAAAQRLLQPEAMAVAIVGPGDVNYEGILQAVGIGCRPPAERIAPLAAGNRPGA